MLVIFTQVVLFVITSRDALQSYGSLLESYSLIRAAIPNLIRE